MDGMAGARLDSSQVIGRSPADARYVITVGSVFQEHIRIGVGYSELTIPGQGRYTDSNLDRGSW